ncbi:RDD family protein [Paenibacillus arenilitoris]|uniref:RDD family protein n=1 Tax=Paenibacillus arenilitoris TaxID=2772299 RepID=A0A927CMU9_9BACL|nr:RDD family protein [Paenibacillus arenilitoris]MBD2869061.1 RDD family protein [Paenibacillus arenilitoris]
MNTKDPAGFWIRFGASILDALIVGVPLAIIALVFTGGTGEEYVTDILSFLYTLLTPILWNGYTIGKRICGIRIVKVSDGQPPGLGTMLLRNVVTGLIYAITLGIAFIVSAIMVGVREDKRSIHDFIAGTEVVYDGP